MMIFFCVRKKVGAAGTVVWLMLMDGGTSTAFQNVPKRSTKELDSTHLRVDLSKGIFEIRHDEIGPRDNKT